MTATPSFPADPQPKLRPSVDATRNGNTIVIYDSWRIGRPIGVTRLGLEIADRLDGNRTLTAIQTELQPLTGGSLVPMEMLQNLVSALDEAYLLDSPRFRELFNAPIRKPSHISCDSDREELQTQLDALFTATGGAGLPGDRQESPDSTGRLRAVLLPHMDYGRGNITYGYGFKELIEKTDAKVFVVIATSHYSTDRFILTRQHFDTPFGTVETDLKYVDQIASLYGDGLYDDVEAHSPEHSIELEVVPLKFLLKDRPFRIVPLLVGSFRDCVNQRANPSDAADISKMVRILREVEASSTDPVCYVISGDLAHIGPKFRDKQKAAGPWLEESRAKDAAILQALGNADPTAYFNTIAGEGDARRICGLSPTWLTLKAARPRSGKILHYQQFIDPTGHESVSFASAAFYG
jgi:MEMO1 family protein